MKVYRLDLDVLKGIAILFVVFYHLGLVNSGYLGVDLFLVINGFLIVPSIRRKLYNGDFVYSDFLIKRITRLLPLVVIASFVSLIVGWYGMLPDSFENLGEEVVASNLFGENILASITTKNYWDVDNGYKPLMHFWYIGIVFQFYLLFPLVLLMVKKIATWLKCDIDKTLNATVCVIFLVSLCIYLLPIDSYSNKFYYLHYRLFEFLAPVVLLNLFPGLQTSTNRKSYISLFCSIVLVFVLGSSLLVYGESTTPIIGGGAMNDNAGLLLAKTPALLIVVIFSTLVVTLNSNTWIQKISWLSIIGKRSYSIFIWHQVIIAFCRCYYTDELSWWLVITYIIIVALIAEISYRLVEQRVQATRSTVIRCVVTSIILMIPSFYIYLHAGVVRDVEELNISVKDAHRGMHGEYCDRVYEYENAFEKNGKKNILVMGNSFARDMGNVLLESDVKDSINLSYISNAHTEDWKSPTKKFIDIVSEADVIFIFSAKEDVPTYVIQNMKKSAEIYGIGTKNFGKNNGPIYFHRHDADYLTQTTKMIKGYCELNERWKESWGEHYIDMMSFVTNDCENVIVFTPDGKYISADCGHLTKAGAIWYSNVMNMKDIVFNKNK